MEKTEIQEYQEFKIWKENNEKQKKRYEQQVVKTIYEYKVIAKVKEIRGFCEAHSKHLGKDVWEIVGTQTRGYVCPTALVAMYQSIKALQFGGTIPWEKDPDFATLVCIDPLGQCIFELRREKGNYRVFPPDVRILDEE
jgi:uncharacterized repeat protein (TIGR04076 family)